MNPLIKELASKALKQPDTDNDGLTVFDNDELEKFAELIIRECADRISNDVRMSMITAENVAHDLRMYFGITE